MPLIFYTLIVALRAVNLVPGVARLEGFAAIDGKIGLLVEHCQESLGDFLLKYKKKVPLASKV
jgi:hypothetical protein